MAREATEKNIKEFTYQARFRVLKKIASGGMGSVYLAEQLGAKAFQKTVAIKTIRRDLLKDSQSIHLFVDEAKLVADLIHENILQVYQMENMAGAYFVVMEYVHGKNLEHILQRHQKVNQRLPVDMSAFIASRVCRALHYAHGKKDRTGKPLSIVHRDVTPSNVMVDYGGVVKLADFGIAKALTMNTPDEQNVLMGKYPYMSPEQIKYKGTDARSDIYSLGLILYEMLCGKRVFRTNDRKEILNRMENFRIKSIRAVNPDVPQQLDAIVMRALEKRTDDRYQSAWKMGKDLEFYMYHDRYGPTNEKLAEYIAKIFPEAKQPIITV